MLISTAFGHHSFGDFDVSREEIVRGMVLSFEWINPHTITKLEVTDDNGEKRTWSFEGMSPSYLGRRGWSRLTLQPGDFVEIVYFPLRNDGPGGMLVEVTLADGTRKVMVNN